jgi:antitoxin PrlF
MVYTATVTQKGQITLPKAIRDALGIRSYEKVNLRLNEDHVKITSTQDFLSLAGTIKVKKGLTALKAREVMEKKYKRV